MSRDRCYCNAEVQTVACIEEACVQEISVTEATRCAFGKLTVRVRNSSARKSLEKSATNTVLQAVKWLLCKSCPHCPNSLRITMVVSSNNGYHTSIQWFSSVWVK